MVYYSGYCFLSDYIGSSNTETSKGVILSWNNVIMHLYVPVREPLWAEKQKNELFLFF